MIVILAILAYALMAFVTLFVIVTQSKVDDWDGDSLVFIGIVGTIFWPLYLLYLVLGSVAKLILTLIDDKTSQLADRIRKNRR